MPILSLSSGYKTAPARTAAAGAIQFGPTSLPASTLGPAALAAVEIRILIGFVLAIALLICGGTFTYRTSVQFANSVEWVAHTQEVRASLAGVSGSLAGAELAQREYLLGADPAQWDEYQNLIAVVRTRLAELGPLTADNAMQQQNLAVLQELVTKRLDAMASGITAFRTYGLAAARAVIGLARKANATQEIRSQVERMDAIEVQLLAARQSELSNVRRTTLLWLLVTLAVACAFFVGLFRGIHREMLARREAENALRGSDLYNRSIVDSSPDCLAVHDLDGRLTQMTPQGLKLMDRNFEALVGAGWLGFWSESDQASARRAIAEARDGRAGRFHGGSRTHAGMSKWWDVIVMPILGADGATERLLSVARDITEVKRAEADLMAANHFLDSLVETLPLMIFVKDAENLRFVRQNQAGLKLLGYTREEMLGKNDHDFFPPEEAEFMIARDREALAAGRMIDIPEETIHTRELGVRTLHTMKLPIVDGQGEPAFLLGISVDITERKLAEQAIHALNSELFAKAEQLETSNKELESFSYSVSHDLRAPLRAIDGFALMIEEDYSEKLDAEGRRYLSVVRENSRRMGALIDDLLAFSRLGRQPVVNREINVEALVREVIDELLQGQSVAALSPAPQIVVGRLPPAHADRILLRQVWINLISNALKYSSKASRPLIEVSGRQEAAENQYSIRDNGVGFSMEYVEKLFGVFQRLHRADEFSGTGVGLAIVHRVITRHGGRVWAEGRIDQGAIFSFALPNGVANG